jgi:MoxR-like ATPase
MRENDSLPDWVKSVPGQILQEASRFVIGKEEIIKNLLVALFSGGHVLLEGVPGVAKTHIAKTFTGLLGCEFRRIQFTPDLLPVDITGSYVFDQKTSEFKLRKGPIFSNIVLIDEINRGTPKTQAGTIEVMQERQVTIEGQTFPVQDPFMVIATMNPLETQGVYPLGEAQLDRFMFKLNVDYPTAEEEHELIERLGPIESLNITPVASAKRVREFSSYVEKVHVSKDVKDYMIDLIRQTRELKDLKLGGSPRAIIHLHKACKARALIDGRDYVLPDDVKRLIGPTLHHRMWLSRDAEIEGLKVHDIIQQMLDATAIPGLRAIGSTK